MTVDTNLLLTQFQKRRNIPVKYDRNLVAATLKAMERVEEIRRRRERVEARRRMSGKKERERRRAENRRVVAEGIHLIAKEMKGMEKVPEETETLVEKDVNVSKVHGTERMRQKTKRRMLVGGGFEDEMEVD